MSSINLCPKHGTVLFHGTCSDCAEERLATQKQAEEAAQVFEAAKNAQEPKVRKQIILLKPRTYAPAGSVFDISSEMVNELQFYVDGMCRSVHKGEQGILFDYYEDGEVKNPASTMEHFVDDVNKAYESAFDKQVGGKHYKDLKIQPLEYTLANNLNFCQGNVVKYVTRYKSKNGIEDLKKAIHYIELLIEFESKNESAK